MKTLVNNIKLIAIQLVLNTKYIFKNWKQTWSLLIPLFLSLFLPILFTPIILSFSMVSETGVIIPSGIIFIFLSFNIRESTIYSNLNTTKNNKYNFYIGIYISMIIASMVMIFIILSFLEIISQFQMLKTGWFSIDKNFKYSLFKNSKFFLVILSTIEMVTIMFAILFFLSHVMNKKNSLYIVVFSLALLNIVFGGALNNYVWVGGDYIPSPDASTYMEASPVSTFPKWMFIPSLMYPFFSSAELLIPYGGASLFNIHNGTLMNEGFDMVKVLHWETVKEFSKYPYNGLWQWNAILVMPAIQIAFYGILGVLLSKLIKKKDI